MKEPIRPAAGPTPAGPYTPGIAATGRLLFVAGQLPIDPATNELISNDVAEQARQALANVVRVVEAAGGSASDIVKVNVYLRDIGDAAAVNAIYAETLPEPYPARTTTQSPLPRGAAIEVDAIAALD